MGLTLKDAICCWGKLCYGRACCLWNCLFAPFVLCFWAFAINLGGCWKVYFNRFFYKFCCFGCRVTGCYWLYKDKNFPPNDVSLGDIGGDSANAASGKTSADVVWLRANKFPGKGKMQLFGATIDSRDICQGSLGDCWLLAALACLAEHKGAINAVFKTKERNPRGKYRLRIYDGTHDKWEHITIDDNIPCDKKSYERDGTCRPLFVQPNGNELYVMLLEKAFAKFCGSFAKIEGGQTIWAIRAMTGDPARWFMLDDGKTGWVRWDMVDKDDADGDKRATTLKKHAEMVKSDTMFDVLLRYHKKGSILCASGSSGKDGLHTGHAYSIIDVRKVNTGPMGVGGTTFQLVQIRNPWGSGEWTGDWGDKSDLWQKHPAVKKAVKLEDVDDGAFWMSWDDYIQNWSKIGVVDRTIDINTLALQIKDDSCCAPTCACCKGCCTFWCCCVGVRRIYFPYRSSDDTVKVGGCCGFCKHSAVHPH